MGSLFSFSSVNSNKTTSNLNSYRVLNTYINLFNLDHLAMRELLDPFCRQWS